MICKPLFVAPIHFSQSCSLYDIMTKYFPATLCSTYLLQTITPDPRFWVKRSDLLCTYQWYAPPYPPEVRIGEQSGDCQQICAL